MMTWRGAHPWRLSTSNLDGRADHDKTVDNVGEVRWPLAEGQARWCNVELRDADGGLWAVTNPVFFG